MSKRIDWLDIARGFGIALVVLGHTVTTVIRRDSAVAMEIYKDVYYIQLPLLFFVSGLAFSLSYERYLKQQVKPYVKTKCRRLMLPYVSYSLLVYIVFSIANMFPSLGRILEKNSYGRISIFKWLRGVIIGNNIYSEHLWYIYSLFVLSLASFLLIKVVGEKYKYIMLVITFICWAFFSKATDYDIIWKTSLRGIWFALGCIFNLKERFSTKKKVLIALLCLISLLGINTGIYNAQSYRIKWLIDFVPITIFILGFLALAQILEAKGEKVFKWLGENSFCVYIFHQPFWGSGLGMVLYGVLRLPVVLCIVVSFVACFAVPITIYKLLKLPALRKARFLLLGE